MTEANYPTHAKRWLEWATPEAAAAVNLKLDSADINVLAEP
jgi:hypothetical protein